MCQMMTVLCQWDFNEQIIKLVILLLYTSENCSRKFHAWVLLYPFSKRRVNYGCSSLRQSWWFRLTANWYSDNRCTVSRHVNTVCEVTNDTSQINCWRG